MNLPIILCWITKRIKLDNFSGDDYAKSYLWLGARPRTLDAKGKGLVMKKFKLTFTVVYFTN